MTAVAESISNGTSLDASYKYDALGRRIEKTINGTTTKYLYDGADIVLEMDENDVATAYYIRTLNIDEPLARIELDSGGNVTGIRFYLADALGSTIALTDENGDIKTRYNYTPFGEPQLIDEASSNPFMFTGREYDNGTGLYYYRARYYSWELGRFISEDPIGLAGGINMYAYVLNNPISLSDPLGLTYKGKGGDGIFYESRPCSKDDWAYCTEQCSPNGVKSCEAIYRCGPSYRGGEPTISVKKINVICMCTNEDEDVCPKDEPLSYSPPWWWPFAAAGGAGGGGGAPSRGFMRPLFVP